MCQQNLFLDDFLTELNSKLFSIEKETVIVARVLLSESGFLNWINWRSWG